MIGSQDEDETGTKAGAIKLSAVFRYCTSHPFQHGALPFELWEQNTAQLSIFTVNIKTAIKISHLGSAPLK